MLNVIEKKQAMRGEPVSREIVEGLSAHRSGSIDNCLEEQAGAGCQGCLKVGQIRPNKWDISGTFLRSVPKNQNAKMY